MRPSWGQVREISCCPGRGAEGPPSPSCPGVPSLPWYQYEVIVHSKVIAMREREEVPDEMKKARVRQLRVQ